jgi:hypothetical protein
MATAAAGSQVEKNGRDEESAYELIHGRPSSGHAGGLYLLRYPFEATPRKLAIAAIPRYSLRTGEVVRFFYFE